MTASGWLRPPYMRGTGGPLLSMQRVYDRKCTAHGKLQEKQCVIPVRVSDRAEGYSNPAATFRSSNFWIFPVEVLGNS